MPDLDRQPGATPPLRGWILYDGECGLCTQWARKWERIVEKRGFALKDLQSAAAAGLLKIPQENVLDDIRVLTPQGRSVAGAEAYLFISRHIWWMWPFYALFRLPVFRWLLERSYRWVNRNRYRFSRSCALPQHTHSALPPKERA